MRPAIFAIVLEEPRRKRRRRKRRRRKKGERSNKAKLLEAARIVVRDWKAVADVMAKGENHDPTAAALFIPPEALAALEEVLAPYSRKRDEDPDNG